ncbi:MAG TPA: hypothetical protein VF192_07015 [Longimicrobiales bacterium]
MEKRTAIAVLILAAAGAAGCNGFPTPIPVEEARTQPPKPLVEQTSRVPTEPPAGLPLEIPGIAGRDWMITATRHTVPASALRPAGSVGARPVYTFAWDEPPYDRLLVPAAPGVYAEYREVWQ